MYVNYDILLCIKPLELRPDLRLVELLKMTELFSYGHQFGILLSSIIY
jgi:hypothetical protein